ncbi:hypothetical protein [Streptomyces sp. TR02-1]|uniref:hypothetical protein n=1 Tax=Streptomyces sp. TR02-1 TaxID=3385977 RepID=UPI0039A2B221
MPLVRKRHLGRGAQRNRLRMLRTLEDLGILTFHSQDAGAAGEYHLEVGGQVRHVESRLVDAYIVGLLDGARISKRTMPAQAEEILASLTAEDGSGQNDAGPMQIAS